MPIEGVTMKHKLMAIAVSAMMIVGIAGIALADRYTTIRGTDASERLDGGPGRQRVLGMGGDDFLTGGKSPDILRGGDGNDILWTGKGGAVEEAWGGRGNDHVHNHSSGESPGIVSGGPGFDHCTGDPHDTFIGCEKIRYVK